MSKEEEEQTEKGDGEEEETEEVTRAPVRRTEPGEERFFDFDKTLDRLQGKGSGGMAEALVVVSLMDAQERREERRERRIREERMEEDDRRKGDIPAWATEMRESLLSIQKRLDADEAAKHDQELVEKATAPFRERIGQLEEKLQAISEKEPEKAQTVADARIADIQDLNRGLGALGYEIKHKEEGKTGGLEDEVMAEVRKDIVDKAKKMVRDGLMKEEEITDSKTGEISVGKTINRLIKLGEKAVDAWIKSQGKEKEVEEIPETPEGPPEASRTPDKPEVVSTPAEEAKGVEETEGAEAQAEEPQSQQPPTEPERDTDSPRAPSEPKQTTRRRRG